MPAPKNPLKQALAEGRVQTGIWVNLASPIAVDLLAGAGFDWLLLDGEHGPNTIPTLLTQAQVIGQMQVTFTLPSVEPLLWVPDIVAFAQSHLERGSDAGYAVPLAPLLRVVPVEKSNPR